ncbi:MAG TPA: LPS assembly lipoprotein LptE [Stellaceae bacterium]|jgi:LPS-assembly lipoprotein|nr:LPS assembly lipoprotein LptE [Stellaceae bacterium]
MSSSRTIARPSRRALWLAPLAVMLTGCGFHPLYAPSGTHDWDPDLAAIDVLPISDRPGQILALALREDLNPRGVSVPKRWNLQTGLRVTRTDLGIQRNATATTSEITVSAIFQITDQGGRIIYSSSSSAVGSFDLVNDAYATQVAAQDARDRAIRQVADEMVLRLAIFVRDQRTKAAAARR